MVVVVGTAVVVVVSAGAAVVVVVSAGAAVVVVVSAGAAVVVVVGATVVVVVVVVGALDVICSVAWASMLPPETLRFPNRSSGLAALMRVSRIVSGLIPGFSVLKSATSPVTCGAAIEVPDI